MMAPVTLPEPSAHPNECPGYIERFSNQLSISSSNHACIDKFKLEGVNSSAAVKEGQGAYSQCA